jgi:hypothetical protein
MPEDALFGTYSVYHCGVMVDAGRIDQSNCNDEWVIVLNSGVKDAGTFAEGDHTIVEKYDTKRRAVSRAKELAENNNRPAVITHDKYARKKPTIHIIDSTPIGNMLESKGVNP